MNFKLKSNVKGITLIALVITIIVLLILAGVSIVMLTSNNGVLTQANSAKEQTNIGEETEKIKLAVTEAKINENEGYIDLTYENLKNTIAKQFGDIAEVIQNADGSFLIKVKDRNYNISPNGTVFLNDPNSLANLITPQNYGDKINYSANGVNDWKIFYNDGNNVFIIVSDYLNNKKIPEGLGIVGEEMYRVKWAELIDSELPRQEICNKYMLKSFPDNKYSMKAVNSLMDTEKWKEFVDSDVADSAIGSPTLEMFCDSWNQKGYIRLYCNNYDERGYYIGIDDKPTTKNYDVSSNIGYNDKLYYPHQELTEDNCWGYLLASTCATDSGNLMRISKSGSIHYRNYGVAREGLRPVVCLNANVKAEKNQETGIWELK